MGAVYHRRFGTGPKHAIFLHCGLAHSGVWRGVADRLGDLLTVDAFDMPGHGRSAPPDTAEGIHDVVTAIARDLLRDSSFLVGHSFGGTVALRLTQELPAQVSGLTLIEPVVMAAAKVSLPDVFDPYHRWAVSIRELVQAGQLHAAAEAFTKVWGGGMPWGKLPPDQQDSFARNMPLICETDRLFLDDHLGVLDPGRLEAVTQDTLLIRGAQSPRLVEGIHQTMVRRMPHARDVVIAGAGHMVPITHPAEVADLIRDQLVAHPVD
ncbi:alpha/beta hydrolase [Mesobacterium sp. TK19101]|uniref:Alpha/beta hydrolase n=1 Tax=Mesobacterium hydrothermale TaxID=3111907 RepID=A0ABU6HJW6_9RHOB|nr:alpha/beta hydrolase [Mesobacterium sp. TK19101]MEC3862739.1 alpha/beta hydrolase [Mesobacterium sp. TK19101]